MSVFKGAKGNKGAKVKRSTQGQGVLKKSSQIEFDSQQRIGVTRYPKIRYV